jgi:hypothetical protein
MRSMSLLLALIVLAGCADTHQATRVPGTSEPLSRQASEAGSVPALLGVALTGLGFSRRRKLH